MSNRVTGSGMASGDAKRPVSALRLLLNRVSQSSVTAVTEITFCLRIESELIAHQSKAKHSRGSPGL